MSGVSRGQAAVEAALFAAVAAIALVLVFLELRETGERLESLWRALDRLPFP